MYICNIWYSKEDIIYEIMQKTNDQSQSQLFHNSVEVTAVEIFLRNKNFIKKSTVVDFRNSIIHLNGFLATRYCLYSELGLVLYYIFKASLN